MPLIQVIACLFASAFLFVPPDDGAARRGGQAADCLMGLTLLRDYVVELDYVTPEVRLHDPKRFTPPPRAVAIPFTLERNNPHAQATLVLRNGDRITANVILDTGAAYYALALLKKFADAHDLPRRVGATVMGQHLEPKDAGGVRVLAARAARLTVGPVQVDRPVIALVQNESPFVPVDGLVGAGFFTRFDVTFDYGTQRMFLVPNARAAAPHLFDASGLVIARSPDGKDAVVAIVRPDSSASVAGLREGDVLVSVDERPAAALTSRQIQDTLRRDGRTCVLRVRRNGELTNVTLRLTRRL